MRAVAQHQVVQARDGNISFGPRQATWLARAGYILDGPGVWHAPEHTVDELNAIVLAFPELRECDFCTGMPAPWRIQCRPFQLLSGPNAGAELGGERRPVFCCDACARYAHPHDRRRLIEHVCAATIARARADGSLQRGVSNRRAKQAILGLITEVVTLTFEHATGELTRDVT